MRITMIDCWQTTPDRVAVGFYGNGKCRSYGNVTKASLARLSEVVWDLAARDVARVMPWLTGGVVGWKAYLTRNTKDGGD